MGPQALWLGNEFLLHQRRLGSVPVLLPQLSHFSCWPPCTAFYLYFIDLFHSGVLFQWQRLRDNSESRQSWSCSLNISVKSGVMEGH